jgi:hypothetical protein
MPKSCRLFKARLDSKMKRWPQQDGDKVQIIGVKLLKMLLYEMESRSVGMDKWERMVSQALGGATLKKEQNERERRLMLQVTQSSALLPSPRSLLKVLRYR